MMKQTALFLDAQMQNYSSWLTTQQELQTQQQLLFEAQAAHFQELVTEEVAILRNYIFIVDTIVKLSVIIVIVVGCLFVLNIVRKSCERALN
jgi:hypothetical protein